MKKFLITVFVVAAGLPVLAQQNSSSTPSNSMTVAEANRANGTAQPVMKDGKPYSQWVAEEKAKMNAAAVQEKNLAKRNSNGNNDGVQSEKAVQPQRNLNVQGSSVEPEAKSVSTEAAIVKVEPKPAEVQKPQVPDQFKLPVDRTWTNKQPDAVIPTPEKVNATPTEAGGIGNASAGTNSVSSQDPSSKQSPSNIVVAEEKQALKSSEMIMKPVEPKEEKPLIKKQTDAGIAKAQPQVPEQFKLPAANTWAGTAVEPKKAEVNSADVQPAEIATPTNIKLQVGPMKNMVLPAGAGGEQNKVQPAATKEIAVAPSSASVPELKVVQADTDPAASKAAEVKPPVVPSSDGKQELPAKKN